MGPQKHVWRLCGKDLGLAPTGGEKGVALKVGETSHPSARPCLTSPLKYLNAFSNEPNSVEKEDKISCILMKKC